MIEPRAFIGRLRAHAWMEAKYLRKDLTAIVLLTLVPLASMWFSAGLYRAAFTNSETGVGDLTVVIGFTVLFSMFVINYVAVAFLREHMWNTWDRVRIESGDVWSIITGKCVVWGALSLLVQILLLGVGLSATGQVGRLSIWRALLVGASFAIELVCCGALLAAVCSSIAQASAIANSAGLALAAIGGAIVPRAYLPDVLERIAPATPIYWTNRGLLAAAGQAPDSVIFAAVLVPLGTSVAMAALAKRRFARNRTSIWR